jgi:predicted  nucleic acid-binding Zn-ribbon protein
VTKTIRIPDEDYEKIRKYADKRDIPMSAALSQYLNVIEEFRSQLHRKTAEVGDSPGLREVDDWAPPREIAEPESSTEKQTSHSQPDSEELKGTITALNDRVEKLEAELSNLQQTIQELHTEEEYQEAQPEEE